MIEHAAAAKPDPASAAHRTRSSVLFERLRATSAVTAGITRKTSSAPRPDDSEVDEGP